MNDVLFSKTYAEAMSELGARWAETGLGPSDGMLCLVTGPDFTTVFPPSSES
jgi:hypothetical protein